LTIRQIGLISLLALARAGRAGGWMGRWTRTFCFLALALTGCVERRFLVESDPPGAFVYQNGQFVGATPVDIPFTYYGHYEFVLVKDGYESVRIYKRFTPPWYQRFPLDFFSENLWPFHLHDNRPVHIQLQPMSQPNTVEILNQARILRERGQAIPGTPPQRE
jgi:hypothetical protein